LTFCAGCALKTPSKFYGSIIRWAVSDNWLCNSRFTRRRLR
jgi:hypothetical protein